MVHSFNFTPNCIQVVVGKHCLRRTSELGESSCVNHDRVPSPSPQHQYLTEALHWRAQTDPDHVLFVLLNAKVAMIS